MKKLMCLILLLCVLLWSGCRTQDDSSSLPPSTSPSTDSTTASTQNSVPPTEPVTPSVLYEDMGTVTYLSGSPDLCSILFWHQEVGTLLVTVAPDTKEVLASRPLSYSQWEHFTFGDSVALLDQDSLNLTVYSSTLEPLWSRSGDDLVLGQLHKDGAFYAIDDNHRILRLSLSDQQEQRQTLPEWMNCSAIRSVRPDACLLEYTDENGESGKKWLNWSTGELPDFQPWEPLSVPTDSSAYTLDNGIDGAYLREAEGQEVFFLPGESFRHLESSKNQALLYEEGQGLVLWNLLDEALWKQPCNSIWISSACGDYVIYVEQGHENRVMFWPYGAMPQEEYTGQCQTMEQLEEDNDILTKEIEAKSGLVLHSGEDGTAFNQDVETGYTSQAVTDPLLIHLALLATQKTVEEFPQGMFEEMRTDDKGYLELYLTGPLSPTGSNSLSHALGFANTAGPNHIVALSIHSLQEPHSFRGTMAHEFMHIMEYRISKHCTEMQLPYLPYWNRFTPIDNAYFYSYTDDNGKEYHDLAYTVGGVSSPEEAFFLDPYSRTYPKEDRARIFEHLCLGKHSPFQESLKTGPLAQKAQYLCAMLRECFPSCQNAEYLPWEASVNTVPFSNYEEAVRAYESEALG